MFHKYPDSTVNSHRSAGCTAGARLVVRGRYSLLLEAITVGPEDYYIGLAAAPSIEYWFPSARTSVFFSIGGGVGLTNSTNVPGGQGQDFTLNWFSQLGLRRTITENTSVLASAYFIRPSLRTSNRSR